MHRIRNEIVYESWRKINGCVKREIIEQKVWKRLTENKYNEKIGII